MGTYMIQIDEETGADEVWEALHDYADAHPAPSCLAPFVARDAWLGMDAQVGTDEAHAAELWLAACALACRWDERTTPILVIPHCECGEWSGERCAWTGHESETVIVEFMPAHLRDTHTAAGNRGTYPHNGARRIRAESSCAERMIEVDGEWCAIVTPRHTAP